MQCCTRSVSTTKTTTLSSPGNGTLYAKRGPATAVDNNCLTYRGRLFDELLTNIYGDMCRDAGQARVTKVVAKPRSKYRPVGLTTTVQSTLHACFEQS